MKQIGTPSLIKISNDQIDGYEVQNTINPAAKRCIRHRFISSGEKQHGSEKGQQLFKILHSDRRAAQSGVDEDVDQCKDQSAKHPRLDPLHFLPRACHPEQQREKEGRIKAEADITIHMQYPQAHDRPCKTI